MSGRIGAALALCLAVPLAAQPVAAHAQTALEERREIEAMMRKAEAEWADLSVKPHPGLLERILADDFVGVSSSGSTRTKAQQIANDQVEPDGSFISSRIDYADYRHYGDTVVAQGQESLVYSDGRPDLQLIWTDVWVRRNGTWQIVATQDAVLPPKTR